MHSDEAEACFGWDPCAFLELLRTNNDAHSLLVTRLDRPSALLEPEFSRRVAEQSQAAGSSVQEWPFGGRVVVRQDACELLVPRADARRMLLALSRRLGHGRPFILAGECGSAASGSVLVRPAANGEASSWTSTSADGHAAEVVVDGATADSLAHLFGDAAKKEGNTEIKVDTLPGLAVFVSDAARAPMSFVGVNA